MNTRTHRSALARKIGTASACALLLATAFSGVAFARPLDQVTVQAPRITTRQVGRTSTGIPIEEHSLSVHVDTTGLDLASVKGLYEMTTRIHAAAASACAEISRLYPLAESSNTECAAAASRPALNKVVREFALNAPTPVSVRELTLAK